MTPSSLTAWRERLFPGWGGKHKAASALGLSQNAYNSYEGGKTRIPRYIELACLAIACGLGEVSASAMMERKFVAED